jgi:hypothetical protein
MIGHFEQTSRVVGLDHDVAGSMKQMAPCRPLPRRCQTKVCPTKLGSDVGQNWPEHLGTWAARCRRAFSWHLHGGSRHRPSHSVEEHRAEALDRKSALAAASAQFVVSARQTAHDLAQDAVGRATGLVTEAELACHVSP